MASYPQFYPQFKVSCEQLIKKCPENSRFLRTYVIMQSKFFEYFCIEKIFLKIFEKLV